MMSNKCLADYDFVDIHSCGNGKPSTSINMTRKTNMQLPRRCSKPTQHAFNSMTPMTKTPDLNTFFEPKSTSFQRHDGEDQGPPEFNALPKYEHQDHYAFFAQDPGLQKHIPSFED